MKANSHADPTLERLVTTRELFEVDSATHEHNLLLHVSCNACRFTSLEVYVQVAVTVSM